MLATTDVNIINALAVFGILLVIPRLYRICDLIWLYFLRRSSVKHYLHGKAPYAIVTGATDGIGKATAAELLTRGFNVILHGRNEAKMLKVVAELRASTKGNLASTPDIRYFIADALKDTQNWERLLEPFRDLHVTVVAHNVTGGENVMSVRIDGHTEEYLLRVANGTAFFALFLTRALLPNLRRAARSGPVQVLFVGSIASEAPPLFLSYYAASKAFLKVLARGLDNDELFFSTPSGVRFTYLIVGSVHSANHAVPIPSGFWVPASARFARSLVESIGCGRRTMTPYAIHAVAHWLKQLWGERAADEASARYMQKMMAQAVKGK